MPMQARANRPGSCRTHRLLSSAVKQSVLTKDVLCICSTNRLQIVIHLQQQSRLDPPLWAGRHRTLAPPPYQHVRPRADAGDRVQARHECDQGHHGRGRLRRDRQRHRDALPGAPSSARLRGTSFTKTSASSRNNRRTTGGLPTSLSRRPCRLPSPRKPSLTQGLVHRRIAGNIGQSSAYTCSCSSKDKMILSADDHGDRMEIKLEDEKELRETMWYNIHTAHAILSKFK